jgi:hypothetical protein
MDWSTLFPAIAQAQAARMGGGGFQPPGLGMPQMPPQAMAGQQLPPAVLPSVAKPQLPPQAMPAVPGGVAPGLPSQPLPAMQPPKLPPQGMIGRGAAPGLPFAF